MEPKLNQTNRSHFTGTAPELPIDTRLTQGGAKIMVEDMRPKEVIISQKLATLQPKLLQIKQPAYMLELGRLQNQRTCAMKHTN